MVRMITLNYNDYRKIRARQKRNSMTELYDEYGYLCYDENELKNFIGKKRGRKPSKTKNNKRRFGK